MSWARLLKRVFDIDIEYCPRCGGRLQIIAAIEDPPVIAKILTHLHLPARAPPAITGAGSRSVPSGLIAHCSPVPSGLAPKPTIPLGRHSRERLNCSDIGRLRPTRWREKSINIPTILSALAPSRARGAGDIVTLGEKVRFRRYSHAWRKVRFNFLFAERALIAPRHIEVQVFGDAHQRLLHLGERDCSIQRRHQKLVEEAPAPELTAELREHVCAAALQAARSVGYIGAGTVEFLFDGREFYFMEMNTRLQVEHPVTEAVTGLDLVEWQLRVARGEPLPWTQAEVSITGHAIEVRLCAEDAALDFLPQSGRIERWRPPAGMRVDHAIADGMVLSPYYDSMLAKIVSHGATREQARERLGDALQDTVLFGVPTNRAFLARVVEHPAFAQGSVSTEFIAEHFPTASARSPGPDDAAWALAAWLSVQPAGTVPAAWQGFSSAGASDLPVRLAHAGS